MNYKLMVLYGLIMWAVYYIACKVLGAELAIFVLFWTVVLLQYIIIDKLDELLVEVKRLKN